MKHRAIYCLCALVLGAALALSVPIVAHADITLAASIDIQTQTDQAASNGAPPVDKTRSVTIYGQGDAARVDEDGGKSVIFDGRAKQVYVLDMLAKNYYELDLKDWQNTGSLFAAPIDGQPASQEEKSADFTNTDDIPGNSGTYAGQSAHKFLLAGSLTAPRRSGGRRGHRGDGGFGLPGGIIFFGGGGWGGGYGGGDGDNSGGYGSGVRSRSTELDGDVWLATGQSFGADAKSVAWNDAVVSTWSPGPLVQTIADKLGKLDAPPLSVKLTFTMSDPGTGNESTKTVDFEVSSVTQGQLSDSLFHVPGDFTQVSPPLPPSSGYSDLGQDESAPDQGSP